MKLLMILLLFPLLGVQSRVFFPEELVSFLSFVYSVIPPFKIGQDSRIGAGFRVGPNADFQILLELGPQSETQPLGPGGADGASTRDVRAPLSLSSSGTNLRKSLKGKKHTLHAKNKNQTDTEVKSTPDPTESRSFSVLNSTETNVIEPSTQNLTESS